MSKPTASTILNIRKAVTIYSKIRDKRSTSFSPLLLGHSTGSPCYSNQEKATEENKQMGLYQTKDFAKETINKGKR